jgi:hypothetical protein
VEEKTGGRQGFSVQAQGFSAGGLKAVPAPILCLHQIKFPLPLPPLTNTEHRHATPDPFVLTCLAFMALLALIAVGLIIYHCIVRKGYYQALLQDRDNLSPADSAAPTLAEVRRLIGFRAQ